MTSFYRRQILQEALSIVWRKKYLWFIGFFAGLVSFGGEADFFFRNVNAIDQLQKYLIAIRETVKAGQADFFFHQVRQFITQNPSTALSYLAILVLLLAVFVWLIITSQATLIRITGRTSQKKSTGLFDGLAAGSMKFWPLVTINVIGKLFVWAVWLILAGIPAIVYFMNGQFIWAVLTSLGWFLVTIPFSIIISFLMKYAAAYIVLRDEAAVQSLRDGWKLFRGNWLVSLELAFLVYLFNLVVSVVVAGVALLFIQPFTPIGLTSLLVVLAIVLGFVSSFSYAAWTLVFLKLVEGKAESKIERWTTNLVNFAGPKKIAD